MIRIARPLAHRCWAGELEEITVEMLAKAARAESQFQRGNQGNRTTPARADSRLEGILLCFFLLSLVQSAAVLPLNLPQVE